MANLKNLDKIFDLDLGDSVTIGNNRVVTLAAKPYQSTKVFECSLHGHVVTTITVSQASLAVIDLDDCGYMTRTTASAMSDFARAFGAKVKVSFAGGKMTCTYKNASGYSGAIAQGEPIVAARYGKD